MTDQRQPQGNRVLQVVVALLIVVAIGVLVYLAKDKIVSIISPKADTTSIIDGSSSQPTIKDVLNVRANEKTKMFEDSIYYALPDLTLAAVLYKIGTVSSISQIVGEYSIHKAMYDDIALGARLSKELTDPDLKLKYGKETITGPIDSLGKR